MFDSISPSITSQDIVRLDVRISGWGLLTPLGDSAGATWRALLDRRCIDRHYRIDIAPDGSGSRIAALAESAAREAMIHANWQAKSGITSALVVGTSKGDIESWLKPISAQCGPPAVFPISHLAERLGLPPGPRLTLSAACASGLHALIRGIMLLRGGQAHRVLVVAAEASVHPLFLGSFQRLGVLARESFGCRPFDRRREGFLMSEGAAAICLENCGPSNVVSPGRQIRVERFAMGSDATHLTAGDPDAKVMRTLLARVTANGPLDLVHAHGTGTILNDAAELAAIESVVCADSGRPSLYSHKGALGHSLGAAGLVGVVLNCLAHQNGIVPPNTMTTSPMEVTRLDLSSDQTDRTIQRSVALAAGFGGPVAAVTLESLE